jgi:hypothetical protein
MYWPYRTVFQSDCWIQTKAFRNSLQAARTKATFGVNVDSFSFGSTIADGHLARYTKGMSEGRFAFTKNK